MGMAVLASPKSREMDDDSRFKISLEKLFRGEEVMVLLI
jgi:hypothetical protein